MKIIVSNWGKTAVGSRMFNGCDSKFFNDWSHLICGGLRKGDTVLDSGIEMPPHMTANIVCDNFLKSDADTLCFIDSDMNFKQDTLNRLRDDPEGWGYDVLGAMYVTRRSPFAPIVLQYDGALYHTDIAGINGKPISTAIAPLGFTLIRRAVFEFMQKNGAEHPWYFEYGKKGEGEDVVFCRRAGKLGFKIGIHTGIDVIHRGPIGMIWDRKNKTTEMVASDQIRQLFPKQKKKGE